MTARGLSVRRSCAILRISRSSLGYLPRKDDSALVRKLKELAAENPCHGYRMLHGSLLMAGWWVNAKKVRRLCRIHGLSQPQRRKRKRRGAGAGMPCRAEYLNHVWSCDFVSDFCDNGRKLRFFTVIEEYTRVCLAVEVNTGFNHLQVIRVMEDLIRMFGAPKFLRTDNGSEFIAKTLVRWLKDQDVQSRFIDPGSPWQNGRNERFNGTLRHEFLNQEVFHHVDHARALARLYVGRYNTERPHSRLKYRPPLEFALGQGMKVRREWYGSGNLARLRGLCPQTTGIYRIGPPVQEGNREVVSRLP